ncbi:MAG: TetR family transcriptional regulator C-terminal domain-containing protein [Desulfosarcinaceae bacterium]
MSSELPTREHLIATGLPLLLERGYNGLGLQALLSAAGVPKGSFYHHFRDKEDFALQVVDAYMREVHAGLDASLGDLSIIPLDRVRRFFATTQQGYREQGYMGCLLGGLGQELSGVSEAFRRKIEACFTSIATRLAVCLEEARERGDLPAGSDPQRLASLLVDCWEGAALRSRLQRDHAPLDAMLEFYFKSAGEP